MTARSRFQGPFEFYATELLPRVPADRAGTGRGQRQAPGTTPGA